MTDDLVKAIADMKETEALKFNGKNAGSGNRGKRNFVCLSAGNARGRQTIRRRNIFYSGAWSMAERLSEK